MATSALALPDSDTISIANLTLPHPVLAPDVWGTPKAQPAIISITLNLRGTFQSAASRDVLDASTIHYGELAKRIRKACVESLGVAEVLGRVKGCVREMGRKEGGKFVVKGARVEMRLPKAGMYAESGVVMVEDVKWDGMGDEVGVRRGFEAADVKIMTLVGVNSCERKARQPLVVGVWISGEWKAEALDVFRLEQMLAQIIEATSFETLESLAEHTIKELREHFLDQALPGVQIRLRLAKPRAIVFADAPAVEVVRQVPGIDIGASGDASPIRLKLIKPYMMES